MHPPVNIPKVANHQSGDFSHKARMCLPEGSPHDLQITHAVTAHI
jgi:hypothetical protein